MVTSKERTGSKTGAIALLFSSAVMLFVLLFGGTASADQEADTTNAGVGGANTGVNGAAGNGSTNGATSDQTATASGTGADAVAPDSASSGNSSTGNATVKTGDANATGNSATNNTQQTVVEGHNGAVVIVDQNATITNIGVGVANTGGNIAVGNLSINNASAVQVADATNTGGDGIASNNATVRNNSGGDARVDTGDATAVGSTSTNTVNQTFDGDFDGLGVVVLVDQNTTVNNIGIGIANTGLNAAVGNGSQNTAFADQDSEAANTGPGDSVAANNATSTTNSGGSAGIITGDATATGNVATNNISQVVNVNAQGSLGSIVLVDQNAAVNNIGISLANTGLNLAVGNLSSSTSNAIQGAVSGAGPPGDSIASNDGIASTDSQGTASIKTGHAESAGNRSTTNLTQVVDVNSEAGGLVLTDQIANVFNIGIAISNTGGNLALGNLSQTNDATVDQTAASDSIGGDAVAANFGSATTNSNGSASIDTGSAGGVGNASTTNVNQTVDATMNGGLALPDQEATVVNLGVGIANTGLNLAVGNASTNTADLGPLGQTATVAGSTDDAVASNFGDASTTSNGDASIKSGNANSIGNDSAATTNVSQTVDANGVDSVLSDQVVVVADIGIGFSNTGLNLAVGNISTNTASTIQTATVTDATGDAVASNFGDAATNSNGSASITTGNAWSLGSSARTNIAQTVNADGDGFLLTDQSATSINLGVGIANSGVNLAIGNGSTNSATIDDQVADIPAAGDGDAVAANFGSAKASSNGSATIHTGDARGTGSISTTNLAQTVDSDGGAFALPDQTAVVANIGIGVANTGVNLAVGNISPTNVATVDQTATVASDDPITGDAVASNDGISSTESNGSAEISTGRADAIGNDSSHTTNITQTSNTNGNFALVTQAAVVINLGVGISNTGVNLAVGNASSNVATAVQSADVTESGPGDIVGDAVAANSAVNSTNSNGSAKITTGAADSIGNAATTNITQTSDYDGTGFVLVDQTAINANIGIAASNTGINLAVGNISPVNTATTEQDASVEEEDAGSIFGDVVASNQLTNSVTSNGSATINTGSAKSLGNLSTATLNQTSDVNSSGGFALIDQTATEIDLGIAISNTGVNLALGNGSTNTAGTPAGQPQEADVDEELGGDIGAVDAPVDVVASEQRDQQHQQQRQCQCHNW